MSDISVVLPVYNEEECIEQVADEVRDVLAGLGREFEVILVDDGSSDGTPDRMCALAKAHPEYRIIRITPNSGQSAAMGAGFRAARGDIIVCLDADGQNDPADIPKLLSELEHCDVCCGIRARRKDTWSRRVGSRLANAVRNAVLHDGIIDTGCSLKAFRASVVSDFPMHLRGMHRFLPVLARISADATIRQVSVNHRPRAAGRSKYTNLGRLKETVADLRSVAWMARRWRRFKMEEIKA